MGFTLKQARNHRNFTQQEIAQHLNIATITYRKLEFKVEQKSTAFMTIETIEKICEKLNISKDKVINENNFMPNEFLKEKESQ